MKKRGFWAALLLGAALAVLCGLAYRYRYALSEQLHLALGQLRLHLGLTKQEAEYAEL